MMTYNLDRSAAVLFCVNVDAAITLVEDTSSGFYAARDAPSRFHTARVALYAMGPGLRMLLPPRFYDRAH